MLTFKERERSYMLRGVCSNEPQDILLHQRKQRSVRKSKGKWIKLKVAPRIVAKGFTTAYDSEVVQRRQERNVEVVMNKRANLLTVA